MNINNIFSCIILIIVMFFGMVTVGNAKVIVKEKTKYYTISGKTGEDLYDQMLKKGPKIKGRNKYDYIATAKIDFSYKNLKMSDRTDVCAISDIDIIVKVVYTMPKRKRHKKSSKTVDIAWDNFLSHVWRHERKHTSIAKKSASELLRTLKNQRGRTIKQCENFGNGLETKILKIADRHNKKQDQFDNSIFFDGGKNHFFDNRLLKAE